MEEVSKYIIEVWIILTVMVNCPVYLCSSSDHTKLDWGTFIAFNQLNKSQAHARTHTHTHTHTLKECTISLKSEYPDNMPTCHESIWVSGVPCPGILNPEYVMFPNHVPYRTAQSAYSLVTQRTLVHLQYRDKVLLNWISHDKLISTGHNNIKEALQ